jgi:hypothetical protein
MEWFHKHPTAGKVIIAIVALALILGTMLPYLTLL